VVPWSVVAFVLAGINNCINTDIASANQLVVGLHGQLEASAPLTATASAAARAGQSAVAPADDATQAAPLNALSDLQQLAMTIRSVKRHAIQLTNFTFTAPDTSLPKDEELELTRGLESRMGPLRASLDQLTLGYQRVRSYAKYTQDNVAAVSGAIPACVLPIFYALLGACAYLLRIFSAQLATKSFAPSYSTIARFVIAAIAGGVVGLFNNFGTGELATLSPLAIAFVAGYAADVFFAFIDGAVHAVSKPKTG
jgi:hypothetical protein